MQQQQAAAAAAAAAQLAYQMVHTPQGLVAAPIHLPPAPTAVQQPPPLSPGVVHGSTPLSQIGANPCPPPSESSLLQGKYPNPKKYIKSILLLSHLCILIYE